MDRIAIISDIHGNIPALEAVLADIKSRGVDRIMCLGDLVGKGPGTVTAVDMIKENCEVVLKGNWDLLVSEDNNRSYLNWHRDKLRQDQIKYLRSLPTYVDFYFSGKLVRLSHAASDDVFRRVRLSSTVEEKESLFQPPNGIGKVCDIFIYGDLHGVFQENLGTNTLINIGSVGNPLDVTMCSYIIIEGNYEDTNQSAFSVSFIRVPYDIDKAVSQAFNSDMPGIGEYVKELRTGVYRGLSSYDKA